MPRVPEHATKVFTGKLFEVYQWEQELFDGRHATFEMLKRQNASVVVALTPEHNVLLINDSQPNREPILTFPGGHIDPGETPLEAAQRELMEETGYSSSEWELWKTYDASSKIEASFYYYIARNSKLTGTPNFDQGGEHIVPKLVTIDEFLDGIITGKQNVYEMGSEIMRSLLQGKKAELLTFMKGQELIG